VRTYRLPHFRSSRLIEAFSDLIQLFHVATIQLVIFTLQFLHIETVESRVFQKVFAQGDVPGFDDGWEEIVDIDGFLLDGENGLAEQRVRDLPVQELLVVQIIGNFAFEGVLVVLGGVF